MEYEFRGRKQGFVILIVEGSFVSKYYFSGKMPMVYDEDKDVILENESSEDAMSISGNNKNELNHEERTLLDLLFEQKISLKECALVLGITKSQAQQALMKILEKTTIYAHEAALNIAKLRENKEYWRSRSKEAERIIEMLCAENDNLRYILNEQRNTEIADAAVSLTDDIKTLGLSVRSYNCLIRHGATSVGDILDIEPHEFARIRNLGKKLQEEVVEKMRELGFNSWVRGTREISGAFTLI
jgi:hypothetical protein